VIMCQHGNRRVVRITNALEVTTVVDSFEGKKFNSPNDVVYRSDGSMYFTDPPYGLPAGDNDSSKELPYNGVFKFSHGKLQLIIKDMTRPNGLAFSPDEKILYVANSDEKYRVWMRYDVQPDGSVSNGSVFADVSGSPDSGLPDGMKIDARGNVWATGPGGVWVFTPQAKHLGTIKLPEQPANCAWGDDGKTLYITAETGLYRVKTSVSGQKMVYA
jgi:gluconolactonase